MDVTRSAIESLAIFPFSLYKGTLSDSINQRYREFASALSTLFFVKSFLCYDKATPS